MIGARELADSVRGEYQLGAYCYDEDLEAICAAERCEVKHSRGISVELGGFYAAGQISLAKGLRRSMVRWLTAHELCHHLRHKGGRFNAGQVVRAKREHDAEVFAGWLLLGGADQWNKTVADLADEHDVPEDRVERWMSIVQGRGASVSAGWARV